MEGKILFLFIIYYIISMLITAFIIEIGWDITQDEFEILSLLGGLLLPFVILYYTCRCILFCVKFIVAHTTKKYTKYKRYKKDTTINKRFY